MRFTGSLLALLFLAACGHVSAGAGRPSSSTPNPGVSYVVSPTRTAAPSTPISELPVTDLNFSCRLPFIRDVGGGHWQGRFLDFPSGAFSVDPSAPPTPGYYDRAASRWLPVGRNAVAPDGRHYAYMTGGMGVAPAPPRLHVVDAATGAERVLALALTDQQPYGVEDYAADGVYIGSGWEGVRFGTWRVDPANGNITDLGKQDHFADDGTGHAWVPVFDSRDPHPALSGMDGSPLSNAVVRRDLKTGTDEVWFYRPGVNLTTAGVFIGGGLLVWVEPGVGSHEYWLVTSPGVSRLIANIDAGGGLADGHGIWLGSLSGLYLFTREGSVSRVSDLLGDPANGCL